MISGEDSARPLSDQFLTKKLNEEGICIARRTVAKYREMLGLPTSRDRKRL